MRISPKLEIVIIRNPCYTIFLDEFIQLQDFRICISVPMSIIMKSQKIKVEKVKTKQLSYPSFILFLSLWSLYFGL